MKKHFANTLEDMAFNEHADVYLQYRKLLKSGIYSFWYESAVMQTYMSYTPSDVLSFSFIHYHILIGNILLLRVKVGNQPAADKAVDMNNEKLSGLPKLFDATFNPSVAGGAWNDGKLSIKGNVIMERCVSPDAPKQYQKLQKHVLFQMLGEWIPLEVGYTRGHITYLHLLYDGAVARWAYGSDEIVIFAAVSPFGNSEWAMPRRVWKMHNPTPLDYMIAQSQGLTEHRAEIVIANTA